VTVQPPAVSDRPQPSRLGSIRYLRPLAIASLVVNMLLVVTGGVVRLTGSGLGCHLAALLRAVVRATPGARHPR